MGFKVKLFAVVGCMSMTAGVCAAQGNAGIRIYTVAHATTPPLSSQAPVEFQWQQGMRPYVLPKPKKPSNGGGHGGGGGGTGGGSWTDPDLKAPGSTTNYSTGTVFPGIGFTGAIPPDTNLAVGHDSNGNTQIVQLANTSYAVFDTSGNALASGDLGVALFANLPSTANCYANADGGDVTVVWDQFDQRWIMGQLAYNADFTQNDYCLAISDTADAQGTYEVYDIPFGNSLPDYPKLAVWGDGIYFSANMFHLKVNQRTGLTTSTFLGAQACSFPLADVSSPPTSISFSCSGSGNTAIYNILPADIQGSAAAPGGTGSDYYLQFVNNLSSTSGNELALYQFNPVTLSLATLGNLSVGTFHDACGGGTCIPQLGTTQLLDSLGDRLMYRLSYRNNNGTQVMVVNHSVQVSSASAQTGIRWYKLCSQAGAVPFNVCGQGTFSPDTSNYRWMGSIAQDSMGNLGLGYSVSGSSTYPGIAVTGMANGESAMEPESLIYNGPNFQDTYNRWGDYSDIAVDPRDGCTFWYTTEYSGPGVLGAFNFLWGTAIGSFHFNNCAANP
jgi:hypothetical protein